MNKNAEKFVDYEQMISRKNGKFIKLFFVCKENKSEILKDKDFPNFEKMQIGWKPMQPFVF